MAAQNVDAWNTDRSALDALAYEQEKATSFHSGNPKLHQELSTHENAFDWAYQEHTFQLAVEQLEKSGKVEKIVIDEAGCEPLVAYRIGDPDVVITSHIHGDEPGPAIPMFIQLVDRILTGDPAMQNILIVPRANAEAYNQMRRGVALNQELLDRLQSAGILNQAQIQAITESGMCDMAKFSETLTGLGYHVSYDSEDKPYIDLNRQYIEQEDGKEPDLRFLFPKARQLLRALRQHAPKAAHGFSFHADNTPTTVQLAENGEQIEVQNGCYLYDTPAFYSDSEHANAEYERFVAECVGNFQTQMQERGIPLLNGIDDIEDEILGMNLFTNGVGQVPALEKRIGDQVVPRTKEMHDQTFETAMVRWGMNRYWCFETAGWINPDRRSEMIQILLDTIVLPILRARTSASQV